MFIEFIYCVTYIELDFVIQLKTIQTNACSLALTTGPGIVYKLKMEYYHTVDLKMKIVFYLECSFCLLRIQNFLH